MWHNGKWRCELRAQDLCELARQRINGPLGLPWVGSPAAGLAERARGALAAVHAQAPGPPFDPPAVEEAVAA